MSENLSAAWAARWPEALAAWSSYTQLRSPVFFESDAEAADHGMRQEIAAIRLTDQVVMVNLATVRRRGLAPHALAILAHEIGHHVYVPGNLADSGRALAAIRRMLGGLPARTARLVENLYGDLLINDRLHRRGGIDMAAVFRVLAADAGKPSRVWALYTRTYEHLWRLDPGTIAPKEIDPEMDADAMLVARIVRSFAGEWLRGARRFAAVLYRYLVDDEEKKRQQTFDRLGLHDTRGAGAEGGIPDGLTEIDASELDDDDGFDDDILDPLGTGKVIKRPGGRGQARRPFEYGQLLEALGLKVSQRDMAIRYYRERALPHLIPFPSRVASKVSEPLAEGTEEWSATDDIDELDVLASVMLSPVVIPGVTTVRRVYGDSPGADPARTPMDLDIYIDCSGSMPNPSVDVSYLALAATILALSALRAGARVQATLWSGPGQFDTTGGFSRDEQAILGVVTGYLGGSTAFPLHVLRDTYDARRASDPTAHVVVVSDDGVDTMLQVDEKGNPGEAVAIRALERARGGGTLVLNLYADHWTPEAELTRIGFRVHRVNEWEGLVAFARAFVRENYA